MALPSFRNGSINSHGKEREKSPSRKIILLKNNVTVHDTAGPPRYCSRMFQQGHAAVQDDELANTMVSRDHQDRGINNNHCMSRAEQRPRNIPKPETSSYGEGFAPFETERLPRTSSAMKTFSPVDGSEIRGHRLLHRLFLRHCLALTLTRA